MTFKCKMCGAGLEIGNETIVRCEYCGTSQTIPKLDDEKRANMYDRAGHFRRNNDFDKAIGIYEQILAEDGTDAEAYWSLVLCKYGIEYVEDPATRRRVPTVNRAQYTSIYDDDNYKSALKYADTAQKALYEAEASEINEIQKGILAISQKEEPFDIFICYKESDNGGRRTPDSVLATELYHELTKEGFKVFFSRITLEDKLGTAYEPYIFAALNSAKVMVVLGTKAEYFNAPWVKNEWSRYLALTKTGAKKVLIPAYRDMDPYDLPEEFSHLQAQDMSKLGFMQDLTRGIKKIIGEVTPVSVIVKESAARELTSNVAALLKRAEISLEDGEWENADSFAEQVLNQDAECALAYLTKLLAKHKLHNREELKDLNEAFDGDINFSRVMRFADEKLKEEINRYLSFISEKKEQERIRIENERLEKEYNKALNIMKITVSAAELDLSARIFESIIPYKDSAELSEKAAEMATEKRNDDVLLAAKKLIRNKDYVAAKEKLCVIKGYKEAALLIEKCKKLIDEQRIAEEKRLEQEADRLAGEKKLAIAKKKRIKRTKIIILAVVCAALVVGYLFSVLSPIIKYNHAIDLMEEEEYSKALKLFEELDGYKDSYRKMSECKHGVNESSVKKQLNQLGSIDVGATIELGFYEQYDNDEGKSEAIEWIILDKNGDDVLLISKHALECMPFDKTAGDAVWNNCSLRTWLNRSFIDDALLTTIKDAISSVTTTEGDSTADRVFLLSKEEAEKYLDSSISGKCKLTPYATNKGGYSVGGVGTWLLRTSAGEQGRVMYVNSNGKINYNGCEVTDANRAVRPAMWIDISKLKERA